MIPKSVLFFWSKGAEIRRKIVTIIQDSNDDNKPIFLNIIAKEIGMSHVAAKKHIDLLVEEEYILPINPKGKPIYLALSNKGLEVTKEF